MMGFGGLRRRIERLEEAARTKAGEKKPMFRSGRCRIVEILVDRMHGPPLNEEEVAKLAAAKAAADEAGERLIVVHGPVGEGMYDGPAP